MLRIFCACVFFLRRPGLHSASSSHRGVFNAMFAFFLCVTQTFTICKFPYSCYPCLTRRVGRLSWNSSFVFYVTESKSFILTQRECVRKIASAAVQTRDHKRSDNPFNVKRVRISSEWVLRGGRADVGGRPSDQNEGDGRGFVCTSRDGCARRDSNLR